MTAPVFEKFDFNLKRYAIRCSLMSLQLGLGQKIIKAQKERMLTALHPYTEALLNCLVRNPVRGPELCMREWWATQGWQWPWEYPMCDRQ